MNKNFDIEVTGMGFNITGFPGAFTPTVKKIIEDTIYGKVLHLFSGQSEIGEERIDIEHINATQRINVKDFLKTDNRNWDWILLDPPYNLMRKIKTKDYGIQQPFSADVELRNLIRDYAIQHTKNILWLDYCAPMIKGFNRRKLWLLLPGGFHNVRVLSWLIKVKIKEVEEMGQIADDMINGFCCSHCGTYFEEPHGYPVLCEDCYKNETEEERAGIQKAHLREV